MMERKHVEGREACPLLPGVEGVLTAQVTAALGLPPEAGPNSANLNYYPQGGGVGFHADDEPLFAGTERDTRIVSLSLGAPHTAPGQRDGLRNFQVKLILEYFAGNLFFRSLA